MRHVASYIDGIGRRIADFWHTCGTPMVTGSLISFAHCVDGHFSTTWGKVWPNSDGARRGQSEAFVLSLVFGLRIFSVTVLDTPAALNGASVIVEMWICYMYVC